MCGMTCFVAFLLQSEERVHVHIGLHVLVAYMKKGYRSEWWPWLAGGTVGRVCGGSGVMH